MHTKMSPNVRQRVVSPAGIAERTCIYPNQAQTLARERVTWQPPTLDCGSTEVLNQAPYPVIAQTDLMDSFTKNCHPVADL